MDTVEVWCRVTVVGPAGPEVVTCVLEGQGSPDLAAVDDVARLALLAVRLGGRIVLAEVSPAFRTLLELADLSVEVEGQVESGEEPLGIQRGQEEAHGGDPPP
jgi:hypothetical protein